MLYYIITQTVFSSCFLTPIRPPQFFFLPLYSLSLFWKEKALLVPVRLLAAGFISGLAKKRLTISRTYVTHSLYVLVTVCRRHK